jgi:hypothetical protein
VKEFVAHRPRLQSAAVRVSEFAARRPWLLPVGALVLVALLLLPVLHAPFFSDDVTSSELNGYREITGDSLVGLYFELFVEFVIDGGRPQVLSGLPGYPVFVLLGDHPTAYHAYILAMTVLDAALVYALLRRLRAPAPAAALVVVLAGAWMQFRIYHDSMISFAGLVQVVLACTLGALLFFARWLDEGRRRDMILAVVLYVAACSIYEVAYSLCAVFLALALTYRRGWSAVRAAAPFVAVAVLFAFSSVLLRQVGDSVAEGYTVSVGGGGIWTIMRTYAVQLISPLPTMSILADPSIAGDPTTGELFAAAWRGLAAIVVVGALGFWLTRVRPTRWAPAVAVGLGLYLTPPVLLSVAGKYQTELNTSDAYLPVLIQVFGLAILAVATMAALLRLAAARSPQMVLGVIAVAALFAGLTAGVTGFNNIRTVGMLQPDREARQLAEAATERGAFSEVPAGSSIFVPDRDIVWQGPVPYRGYHYLPLMLADRTGDVYDARQYPSEGTERCPRSADVVQLVCAPPAGRATWARFRLRPDGGTAIVAQLSRPVPKDYPRGTADRLIVYRETDDGTAPAPPELTGGGLDKKPWTAAGVTWRKLRGGDDWALYAGDVTGRRPVVSTLDDPKSFIDFRAVPPPPQRARLLGTKRLLP